MAHEKAYFIDSDFDQVYELSPAKKKALERSHPNWTRLDSDKHLEQFDQVRAFFKEHGKLIACHTLGNVVNVVTLSEF